MQFRALLVSAFAATVAAQFGGMCFDAGDCLIQGGGQCVKTGTSITGTCEGASSTLATATASGSTPAATGSICFDAGDCILSGGGQCVKASGSLLGNCS